MLYNDGHIIAETKLPRFKIEIESTRFDFPLWYRHCSGDVASLVAQDMPN